MFKKILLAIFEHRKNVKILAPLHICVQFLNVLQLQSLVRFVAVSESSYLLNTNYSKYKSDYLLSVDKYNYKIFGSFSYVPYVGIITSVLYVYLLALLVLMSFAF